MIKKILIVTETPPGTPNGFGVTLCNLFKSIDHDVVYTDPSFKKEVKGKDYTLAHCPYHHSKKGFFLYITGLIPKWRNRYSNIWYLLFLRKSYWGVYCFFYSLETVKLAEWISNKKKCKLFVHIADHDSTFFSSKEFEAILKKATRRITIGENMRDAYEKKYSKEFLVFHNYAKHSFLPFVFERFELSNIKKEFNILFLGSLFEFLHKGAIDDICDSIKQLNNEGFTITFNIYGQKIPKEFLDKKIDNIFIKYHGEIAHEKRFLIMKKHHMLVIPSSFDEKISKEYCYSIPTKLTEYIASGIPTLIYGPDKMESYRFCKRRECCILETERSILKLKKKIIDVIENYEVERELAIKNATELSKEDVSFNQEVDFIKMIYSC